MNKLDNLNTIEMRELCENAGLDMSDVTLAKIKFVKYVCETHSFIYNAIVFADGEDLICICEMEVCLDSNSEIIADFAGTPLFESNDISAISDVWKEGPVRLNEDFNPVEI